MPVPTTFADLSTTIGSNSPAGSDNVFPSLDDYLRALAGFIASISANSGNGWTSPYLTTASPSYTGTLTGGTGVVNLGSGQFYKDASGNVGIGAAPAGARRLEVYSGAAQTDVLVGSTSAGNTGLVARWDNASGNGYLYTTSAVPLLFGTNSTERMRIDASGNVGIGTSSPTVPCDVNGAIRTRSTTVAILTAAATAGAGARHFVTDATATTFASVVAGGGANGVPVYSDGTNWRIG